MTTPIQTPFLELQKQLWKARAQAKQTWLEQSLAQQGRTSHDAVWRQTWIKRALNMVKRGQAEIKHHAALMDAYAEHLSALEMTLMAAVEQKRGSEETPGLNGESAEPRRNAEESPNLRVETGMATGPRSGESLKRRHA